MSTGKDVFVSFNQDAGCFAVGSDQGFRIYNVDPFQEMFHRDFPHGGIGIIEMLFRSNILALVGGGLNPRHPKNKVMIWDDHQSRSIGEISCKSEVLAVRLRRDLVVVVVERTIYLYQFRDLKQIDRIETVENKLGLCALSPSSSRQVLACPGKPGTRGQLRVEVFGKPNFIDAHESELAAIALNTEGTMVATASQRGTLIRVFDTETGAPMHELRRGTDPAVIHSIAFHPASTHIACSSDKGTAHVFLLSENDALQMQKIQQQQQARAPPSSLVPTDAFSGLFSSFKSVLPKYFSSEWSFAQFRITDCKKTLVAFGSEKHTIIVVGVDGQFFKASYEKGGECEEKSRERFYRPSTVLDDTLDGGGANDRGNGAAEGGNIPLDLDN
jgi:WD40 repeat protein